MAASPSRRRHPRGECDGWPRSIRPVRSACDRGVLSPVQPIERSQRPGRSKSLFKTFTTPRGVKLQLVAVDAEVNWPGVVHIESKCQPPLRDLNVPGGDGNMVLRRPIDQLLL